MDLRERSDDLTSRHPWETVRAKFFARILSRALEDRGRVDLLDLGAGDGFVAPPMLETLPAGSTVTCVDPQYTDADLAVKRPGVTFAREVPTRAYDAVAALDVIEHVDDDVAFVREVVVPALAPDGHVLVSVPAVRALYSQHDVMLGHRRRYSAATLRETLEAAGLRVVRSGGLFASLVVPRAVTKLFERVRGVRSAPGGDAAPHAATGLSSWSHGRMFTTAVRSVLELDARVTELASRASLPSVGLSQWALCAQR